MTKKSKSARAVFITIVAPLILSILAPAYAQDDQTAVKNAVKFVPVYNSLSGQLMNGPDQDCNGDPKVWPIRVAPDGSPEILLQDHNLGHETADKYCSDWSKTQPDSSSAYGKCLPKYAEMMKVWKRENQPSKATLLKCEAEWKLCNAEYNVQTGFEFITFGSIGLFLGSARNDLENCRTAIKQGVNSNCPFDTSLYDGSSDR